MSYININEPDWSFDTRRLGDAKLKAERDFYEGRAEHYRMDLDSIFTRIANGETVELHYSNGDVIEVARIWQKPRPVDKEAQP